MSVYLYKSCIFRTPVMIGGIFAVDKKYFMDLGGFDAGMEIWGGENLELSFRVSFSDTASNINPLYSATCITSFIIFTVLEVSFFQHGVNNVTY